jgi:hypothetical protein
MEEESTEGGAQEQERGTQQEAFSGYAGLVTDFLQLLMKPTQ